MKEKVIIIGGGVAGLSAGIYAAMNGFETEIIEMHSVAGGQCTAWDRSKFPLRLLPPLAGGYF